MAGRPIGLPGAPALSTSTHRGDDALSMVLSPGEIGSPRMMPPVRNTWRRLEAQILGILGESYDPLTIDDLARHVDLSFLNLSELLLDLIRRNEVILCGPPGKETVCLSAEPTR